VSRFTNQKKGVHVKHPRHYDAVVIGAGQRGGPLSSALAQSGRRTALIERDHVGQPAST
jgi:pyruvate/2-oxoglutarate dehydrogenase complex dihydrolipoamide dehydrogenase (E3) component